MSGFGGEGLIKAVVVTRGRTGSSAITQELGMVAGARSEQEVFSAGPDLRYYDFPPFNEWRRQREDELGSEEALADAYLDALERDAVARGCRALFWKALSQHFTERPYLAALLRRRGYKAIYLRRGAVRQVLSGFVARQRGLYNTYEAFEDASRYRIDLTEFDWHVKFERLMAERDLEFLTENGLEAIEVTYEDFMTARPTFFHNVFQRLGLPVSLPQSSRFVRMIEDLQATIENYDEVQNAAALLGEPL
jgi:LPS sulfotransferase NodH